ncbi:MAG: DUF11 domain-containing protein, partial [Chloroflexi bacterium]|nr:DUF11 domain-containing protein [Chloroflexota bacterium]
STVGWACVPNNNAGSLCSLSVGTVAGGGAGGAVTFAVTVVTPLPAGVTQISNTACVAGDRDLGPNCGSDDTPVPATPDLVITKDDGGISTTPGGTVTYTLIFQNVGNQGATGVKITDTVPAHTTFNPGASTAGWVCVPNNAAGSVCTYTVGALGGGGAGSSITFVVVLDDPMDPRITKIDNVTWIFDDGANGPDPTPLNNSDWDDTPVSPKTAIQLATFAARWQVNGVRLEWSTLSEQDIVGFNVYRSGSPKYHGDRVNAAPIPVAGLPGAGGQYSLSDSGVSAGGSVYYWLEVVGAGASQWFGPISPRWNLRVFIPLSTGR